MSERHPAEGASTFGRTSDRGGLPANLPNKMPIRAVEAGMGSTRPRRDVVLLKRLCHRSNVVKPGSIVISGGVDIRRRV